MSGAKRILKPFSDIGEKSSNTLFSVVNRTRNVICNFRTTVNKPITTILNGVKGILYSSTQSISGIFRPITQSVTKVSRRINVSICFFRIIGFARFRVNGQRAVG